MFNVIIWIAIIYYVVQKIRKQSSTGTQQNGQSQSPFNQNRPVQNRPVQNSSVPNRTIQNTTGRSNSSQSYNGNFAVMPEHKKVPPNVERDCRVEDKHRSENNVSGKSAAKPTAVPNVQRAYTEAPKQTREQKKTTRMLARRLYEGDHVPQGHRMVKCSYCAAENLIAYSAKGNYMCYFCHTDLK